MGSEMSPIGSRISYSPEVYAQFQARHLAREAQVANNGPLTLDNMSKTDIQAVQTYMNGALGHIQQLRYPGEFPDIGISASAIA